MLPQYKQQLNTEDSAHGGTNNAHCSQQQHNAPDAEAGGALMTLEQCIERYGISAPDAGVGQGLVSTLLPFILLIAAFALIFGIYLWHTNRHTRRATAHRPGRISSARSGFLSLFAVASLATGGLALTTQSHAQQIPSECQQYVNNNNGTNTGNNDNDDDTGQTPSTPSAPTTMQTMTRAYCTNHMTTYTGTNEEAVLSLTDSRGGTTQTYRVAKLADGNCWMLDNLKLGSTTAPITLTPADSNVASNFTLPQLNDGTRSIIFSGPGNDHDTPYAYGGPTTPLDANPTYGYLYNFSAATAGETRTSHDENAGDAPNSICAAGWRLPRSGYADTTSWPYQNPFPTNDFANLDIAFGGTGTHADSGESNIAQWQPTGAFKGTYSGYWGDGFFDPGGWGNLWSASASPGSPDYAFSAFFGLSGVYPGDGYDVRGYGFGVRCLLN